MKHERLADKPAGSSPSMKWINPPVAYMLHASMLRLLAYSFLVCGDTFRVALKAYPGLLAREVLGQRS